MCLLVNTYPSCALFGHPTEAADAERFDQALCDEASVLGTFGTCQGISSRNVPDFASPYCTECNEVEADMHLKVAEVLEVNERPGASQIPLITESFLSHLRGLPIDRTRAPEIVAEEILRHLGEEGTRALSVLDKLRAYIWATVQSPDTGPNNESRNYFASWVISVCRIAHIEAAEAIAKREEDDDRLQLLQLLAIHTQAASVYRARLESIGQFQSMMLLSGITKLVDTVSVELSTEVGTSEAET
ncbi:hypothetical protein JX265_009060 [Neoarthrinium moseri]|uniref:Uncharacterized protein n=1 Tax=Neoarthrinium moseri TaxID=1658444 RepID=A0A9P9WH92_9PEZI|nr:uncharacterized protein JN550_011445 [Neoarthrinium moseri]KAI1846637.1 hypothetical protein JX266_007210 [Neoarthrinium moseri]KAI1860597.1 hypothetical protein JN550_011445 [Neoarthrinium moseri]KAI1863014.1 hypothetical protein JX265_009060 [Neoarthrinium moseri]